jgi:hypothetical protein
VYLQQIPAGRIGNRMFEFILGILVGVFVAWVWLTQQSPAAKKIEPSTVDILCYHCGRMYKTAPENMRVPNYCFDCRD